MFRTPVLRAAASTFKSHHLDLTDRIKFPTFYTSPPRETLQGKSWIWLLDVVEAQIVPKLPRPYYIVKDLTGKPGLVASYTEDPWGDHERLEIKPGTTLAVEDMIRHRFVDTRVGLRVEDASCVEVLPNTLARVREINDDLLKLPRTCRHCDKPTTTACPDCFLEYCSADCQKAHWSTHKNDCETRQKLWSWNALDWDEKDL